MLNIGLISLCFKQMSAFPNTVFKIMFSFNVNPLSVNNGEKTNKNLMLFGR